MKFIMLLLIATLLIGCSNNNVSNIQKIRTVEYELDDGFTKVNVRYNGMPQEIASKFLIAASEQKEQYIDYWRRAFYNDNTSLEQRCNSLTCTYSLVIYSPCDNIQSVKFASTGEYPDLKFSYVRHSVDFWEDCFPGLRLPWWKRIFR